MKDRGSALYQLTLLVLSFYVLASLFVESFLPLNPEIDQILQYIDVVICCVFLLDFFYNFFSAPDKRTFMKWGWIDLISSIPMIDPFRWGRLSRVVRIFRVLRALKSAKLLYKSLIKDKMQSLSLLVFLLVFVTFSVSTILILHFESEFQSELSTAEGALWWAFLNLLNAKVSILAAKSAGGEIVTVVLNKLGVLLFAYFNSIMIAWLVKRKTAFTDKRNVN
ncbi:MAG: ion transporter [Bacteroidota bacterium]